MLQSGIHTAQVARIRRGHFENDVIFKPVLVFAHRQRVDLRRLRRGSIGPPIIVIVFGSFGSLLRHQRNRCQHGHRRLTHGNDMHVRSQVLDELDHILDVIVQMKRPGSNGTIRALIQSVMYTS